MQVFLLRVRLLGVKNKLFYELSSLVLSSTVVNGPPYLGNVWGVGVCGRQRGTEKVTRSKEKKKCSFLSLLM